MYAAAALSFLTEGEPCPLEYRNFLALPYEELEELNLAAKADRTNRVVSRLCGEKLQRS